MNIIKGQQAINKYGAKGKDGVIEIYLKKDPSITLSGMRGPTISPANIKDIKEVNVDDPNYKIVSATVYISGVGFDKVKAVQINSSSLQSLQKELNSIVSGSILTLDNVRISKLDGSGLMEIQGRSFAFNENTGGQDKVFTEVENKAEFSGGQAAFKKFLEENLDATVPISENWKAGIYTVNMKFIVSRDGSISDISTNDFPGSKTAQMCIALLKKSPDWIPAKQNGHLVKSYRTQPITFTVTEAK